MKTVGRYKYDIDADNAIRIWDLENPDDLDRPFCYQPCHPNNTPWTSTEDAEAWVLNLIDGWINPPVEEPVIEDPIAEDPIVEDTPPVE